MGRTMFCACSFHGNSMNNLMSYCGLIDAKIRATDKDLSVMITLKMDSQSNHVHISSILFCFPQVGIATHIHYDHSGGNKYFENFAIHALEARHLQEADENQMFPFIAKNELLFTPSNSHLSGNYNYHVDKRSKKLPLQCLNNGDRFHFGTDG